MNHDIHVFGSVIRGEVDASSDIDILVIPESGIAQNGYPVSWSVYSRETIAQYYSEGRLFAWHLHFESRCLYCFSGSSWLISLGEPAPYVTAEADIADLYDLLQAALRELDQQSPSFVYEVGLVYTAIRDIAMCASWSVLGVPCFSRRAPYLLPSKCPVPERIYNIAMAARHCSTRGGSPDIENTEYAARMLLLTPLESWVNELKERL